MNRAGLVLSMTFTFASALGCAGVKPTATPSGTAGGSGNSTGLGGFGGSMTQPMPCVGMCMDFPATPRIEAGAPANAATIFGDPGSGAAGGPCIIEPQENTLLPYNWLRPRFRFTTGAGLYEIRLHAANQANDLVVYTTSTTWTMPKEIGRRSRRTRATCRSP